MKNLSMAETEKNAFHGVLQQIMRVGTYGSVTEAVSDAFVYIRTQTPQDNPLRKYSEKILRAEALAFSQEQHRTLNPLTQNKWDTLMKHRTHERPYPKVFDERVEFVSECLNDPRRPRIAFQYGLLLEEVPAQFDRFVRNISRTGDYASRSWCNTNSRFSSVSEYLSFLDSMKENLVLTEITKVWQPAKADWPYPPRKEEIDVYTRLMNDARTDQCNFDYLMQTSLSGASPEELIPTTSGKRPVLPRAAKHLRGGPG